MNTNRSLCFEKKLSRKQYECLAACGIIGPFIYNLFTLPMEVGCPGYSSIHQNISELGARGFPHHIVVDAIAFPVLGISLILFTIALYKGLGQFHYFEEGTLLIRKIPRVDIKKWFLITGCVLELVAGFSVVMTGYFPCDRECLHLSWVGKTHTIFAVISSMCLPVGAVFLIPCFPRYGGWKWIQILTIISVILMTIFGCLQVGIEYYRGIFQRMASYIAQIWIISVATMLILTSYREDRVIKQFLISTTA